MKKLSVAVALLIPAISIAGAWVDPDTNPSSQHRTKRAPLKKITSNKLAKVDEGSEVTGVAGVDGETIAQQPTASTNTPVVAASFPPAYYGPGLCANPGYECRKIASGESWDKLFPDESQRDLVQRINRSYNALWPGKTIVVPKDLATATLFTLSPFAQQIDDREKQVIIDQDKLAWAAYDANGQLVNWGPVASGITKCPDSASSCLTLTGIYRVFSKENVKCKSDIFPIGKGGAKMPYCMYFHKGFALHGSDDMPGYRASHGCVRMFVRDAKWLNEEFVETSNEKNNNMGTKVVVRPVLMSEKKSISEKKS